MRTMHTLPLETLHGRTFRQNFAVGALLSPSLSPLGTSVQENAAQNSELLSAALL